MPETFTIDQLISAYCESFGAMLDNADLRITDADTLLGAIEEVHDLADSLSGIDSTMLAYAELLSEAAVYLRDANDINDTTVRGILLGFAHERLAQIDPVDFLC